MLVGSQRCPFRDELNEFLVLIFLVSRVGDRSQAVEDLFKMVFPFFVAFIARKFKNHLAGLPAPGDGVMAYLVPNSKTNTRTGNQSHHQLGCRKAHARKQVAL